MPKSATITPTDEHADWSVHCKAGNFELCDDLKFRCKNPRHADGETAKQRSARLIAEARATRTGEAAATPPSAPTPRTETSAALRGRVLAALISEDGEVVHVAGRATAVLAHLCDYDGAVAGFTQLLHAMETDGLVERDKRGTKTFRISISDAGERLAHQLGIADKAPLPRPRPAAPPARPKLVDVSAAPPVQATPQPIRSRDGGRPGATPTKAPTHPRDPKLEVVFEDPPTRKNGRRSIDEILDHEGVLDALRARPGEWARIISYGGGSGATDAARRLRAVDRLTDFEFLPKRQPRSTSSDVAGSILYARFNQKEQP